MTPMSKLLITAFERQMLVSDTHQTWSEVKANLKMVIPECLEPNRKAQTVDLRVAVCAHLYYNKGMTNAQLLKIFNVDNTSIVYYKKRHQKFLNFDKPYTELYLMVKRGDFTEIREKFLTTNTN